MIVTSKENYYKDMVANLSSLTELNHAFETANVLDVDGIDGFRIDEKKGNTADNFDYAGFLFSDKFNLAKHFKTQHQQLWPFIDEAFSQSEKEKYGFTRELFNDSRNRDIVRRAIVLFAVAVALDKTLSNTKDAPHHLLHDKLDTLMICANSVEYTIQILESKSLNKNNTFGLWSQPARPSTQTSKPDSQDELQKNPGNLHTDPGSRK